MLRLLRRLVQPLITFEVQASHWSLAAKFPYSQDTGTTFYHQREANPNENQSRPGWHASS